MFAHYEDLLTKPAVAFALYSTIGVVVVTLLLLIEVMILRASLVSHERRAQSFLGVWRPIIAHQTTHLDEPFALSGRVQRGDNLTFLNLWLNYQESLRGQARNRLNGVAKTLGTDKVVRRLAMKGDLEERLLSITALGHLQDREAWEELKKTTESDNPYLSVTAARALVLIDPNDAMPFLAPLITRRADWSPTRVVNLLRFVDQNAVSDYLGQAALTAEPTDAARLVQYLAALQCAPALPAIRTVLQTTTEDHVTGTCLKALSDLGSPEDLPTVRKYVTHPRWHIRCAAANALGKMGVWGDEERLFSLLSDEQWWVRYRAAQALAGLPFVTRPVLDELMDKHPDAYARGILAQVIAERDLAERQLTRT